MDRSPPATARKQLELVRHERYQRGYHYSDKMEVEFFSQKNRRILVAQRLARSRGQHHQGSVTFQCGPDRLELTGAKRVIVKLAFQKNFHFTPIRSYFRKINFFCSRNRLHITFDQSLDDRCVHSLRKHLHHVGFAHRFKQILFMRHLPRYLFATVISCLPPFTPEPVHFPPPLVARPTYPPTQSLSSLVGRASTLALQILENHVRTRCSYILIRFRCWHLLLHCSLALSRFFHCWDDLRFR